MKTIAQTINKQPRNHGDNVKRFKTPVLYSSMKKLIIVIRYLQKNHFTINQTIKYLYCLNKKYAQHLCKFFQHIAQMLINDYKFTLQEAENRTIQYIVIEKTDKKKYRLRYAAKGRAYRTCSTGNKLSVYIN